MWQHGNIAASRLQGPGFDPKLKLLSFFARSSHAHVGFLQFPPTSNNMQIYVLGKINCP